VRVASLVVAVFAAGCNCQARLNPQDVQLSAPSPLVLPDAYVGGSSSAVLMVQNSGGATGDVVATIASPFSLDATHLHVPGHASARLTVRFTPAAVGPASTTPSIGQLNVAVTARALTPPACTSTVCATSRFDFDAGVCVETNANDGTHLHLRLPHRRPLRRRGLRRHHLGLVRRRRRVLGRWLRLRWHLHPSAAGVPRRSRALSRADL
jgi:hypothetical protein